MGTRDPSTHERKSSAIAQLSFEAVLQGIGLADGCRRMTPQRIPVGPSQVGSLSTTSMSVATPSTCRHHHYLDWILTAYRPFRISKCMHTQFVLPRLDTVGVIDLCDRGRQTPVKPVSGQVELFSLFMLAGTSLAYHEISGGETLLESH
jgi:hypothetical protein